LELEEAGKEMTGVKALETLRGVRRVEFSVESDEAVVVKTTELSDEQKELAHVFDFSS
jgi:copper chaperone CopZ